MTGKDINVLALVRDGQRYVFLFDDDSCEAMLEQLRGFARDPDLSFSNKDAEMLAEKVNRISLSKGPGVDFPRFQLPQ